MSGRITLRIRTQLGTWRVNDISLSYELAEVRDLVQKQHHVTLSNRGSSFSMHPDQTFALPDSTTVARANLKNGDMLYAQVDESASPSVHESNTGRKLITKDGRIVAQQTEHALQSTGFRPGMLPLRSMKMQWTLNEFIRMDDQFVFKIKAQEKSFCSSAKVSTDSLQNFQSYVKLFDYNSIRIGFCYGRLNAENEVTIECIYEPPQECTEHSFRLLEDTQNDALEKITNWLGLRKVGWVFAHPPREKGFFFSGAEILFAAEQQLEFCGGVGDCPFVTIKLTLDENSQTVVEAFQVSKQCMEMIAEGALEISSNPGCLHINNTFTAIVEGKDASEVDNTFFLVTCPILQFSSQYLLCTFPHSNRLEVANPEALKRQLSKVGKQGWTLVDVIADLELLLYISRLLSLDDDVHLMCQSIADRDISITEGHELLLRSIAGLL